jgi:hypothetical protein
MPVMEGSGGGRRRWPGNAPAEVGMRGAGAVGGGAGRRGAVAGEAGKRGAGAVGASTTPSRGRRGHTGPAWGIERIQNEEDWRLTVGTLPKLGNTPQLPMYPF